MTALGNAYDHCADAKEASVGGRACEDMAMSRPDSTAASMSAEASTSSELRRSSPKTLCSTPLRGFGR